jgi:hypothetical protein
VRTRGLVGEMASGLGFHLLGHPEAEAILFFFFEEE